MSTHIEAKAGTISETVILPGDPLRAKFIAETYLDNCVCYNNVRNMLGFTGTYKGLRLSVQGTGMGVPSISIYVNELFNEYKVKRAIRVGTAGAIIPLVKVRDLVLAMTASTDSNVNNQRFNNKNFAPPADFYLLKTTYENAVKKGFEVKVGAVLTTDLFYNDEDTVKRFAKYGVLAVEMETAELYTLAAKYGCQALSILTISDSIVTNETTSAQERQTSFNKMIEIALDSAIA
ncbi:purine nucleoside phosphorylase DeoD-type [Spirochaetia bacterium]|nr:purine nucleoside phosphorylase DeoD-type [Spirochaetia bacterium]GHV83300.1 purine nucleoside phosphorylase DeoD-type [Spirochaetia bacterium]